MKGIGDDGVGRGLGKGGMANRGCHGGCEVKKGGGRWRDDERKGIKDGEEKEEGEEKKGKEERRRREKGK